MGRCLDVTTPWDDTVLREPGWVVANDRSWVHVTIQIGECDARPECFAVNPDRGEFGCYVLKNGIRRRDADGNLIRVFRRPTNYFIDIQKRT